MDRRRFLTAAAIGLVTPFTGNVALAQTAQKFSARDFAKDLIKLQMDQWSNTVKDLDKEQKISVYRNIENEAVKWYNFTNDNMDSFWSAASKGRWREFSKTSYARTVPFETFREIAKDYNTQIGEALATDTLELDKFVEIRKGKTEQLDNAYNKLLQDSRIELGLEDQKADLSISRHGFLTAFRYGPKDGTTLG